MKSSLRIGNINHVPISLHWTFLLLIGWIITVNFLEGFTASGIVWSLLLMIFILASILLHELGHAFMSNYYNIRIHAIVLSPVGSISKVPLQSKKPVREILILLSGPVVNLVIAGLLIIFIHPFRAYWADAENIGAANAGNFLFQLVIINLSLGIVNLLPVFPMDGGGVFFLLANKKLSKLASLRIVNITSQIIAFTLMIFGLIAMHILFMMLGLFILTLIYTEDYYWPPKNEYHHLHI